MLSRNGRGITVGIPGVHDIVAPLPFEVLKRLQEKYYSDAVNNEDPIDVFADISGIEIFHIFCFYPNLE